VAADRGGGKWVGRELKVAGPKQAAGSGKKLEEHMRTSTVGIKAYTGRKKERVESLKERAF
jgi:hypothetical protein